MGQYVVLAIVLIIFFGIWLYLWNLDRRIQRFKEDMLEENQEVE